MFGFEVDFWFVIVIIRICMFCQPLTAKLSLKFVPVFSPARRVPAHVWTSQCPPLWRVLWTWPRSRLGPPASHAAPRCGLLQAQWHDINTSDSTSTPPCLKQPWLNNLINAFYANALILRVLLLLLLSLFEAVSLRNFIMYHLCMFIWKSLM